MARPQAPRRPVLVSVVVLLAVTSVAWTSEASSARAATTRPIPRATGWSVTFTSTFQGTDPDRGQVSGKVSGTIQLAAHADPYGTLVARVPVLQKIDYESYTGAPPPGCTRVRLDDGYNGIVQVSEPNEGQSRYDVLLGLSSESTFPPPGEVNFGSEVSSCPNGMAVEQRGGQVWNCIAANAVPASENGRGSFYYSLRPGETRTFTGTAPDPCPGRPGFSGTHTTTVTLTTPPLTAPTAPRNVTVRVSDSSRGIDVFSQWAPPASTGDSGPKAYYFRIYSNGALVTSRRTGPDATSEGMLLPFSYYGRPLTIQVAHRNLSGVMGPEGGQQGFVVPIPFEDTGTFVTQTFQDVLDRAPTATERSTWVTRIDARTTTPGDLLTALRTNADATGNVDPVVRLYRAYFLRDPEVGGFDYWLGQRRAGRSLAWVSSSFASSPEFRARYGTLTNQQFVALVYQNILGRPGEPSGVAYWTGELDAGRKNRGGVMLGFSESPEYKTRLRFRVHTLVLFLTLLDGLPPVEEINSHERTMASNPTTGVADLAHLIIGLPEYRERFG